MEPLPTNSIPHIAPPHPNPDPKAKTSRTPSSPLAHPHQLKKHTQPTQAPHPRKLHTAHNDETATGRPIPRFLSVRTPLTHGPSRSGSIVRIADTTLPHQIRS